MIGSRTIGGVITAVAMLAAAPAMAQGMDHAMGNGMEHKMPAHEMAGHKMMMSPADSKKMAACNAMSHADAAKDAGCAALMKAHPDAMHHMPAKKPM